MRLITVGKRKLAGLGLDGRELLPTDAYWPQLYLMAINPGVQGRQRWWSLPKFVLHQNEAVFTTIPTPSFLGLFCRL